MNKRYNAHTKALDLEKFGSDPAFGGSSIKAYLFEERIMNCVVETIKHYLADLEAVNLSCNNLFTLSHFGKVVEKAPHIKIIYLENNKVKLHFIV